MRSPDDDQEQLELPLVARSALDQELAARYELEVETTDGCQTCDGSGVIEIDQFNSRRGHFTKMFPCPGCTEPSTRLTNKRT